MRPPPALLVGAGGVAGALLRHAVSTAVDAQSFPAATLTVNVVGTFALGLLAFGGVGGPLWPLVATGACGSFTTFSSFAVESVRLWESGDRTRAAVYAAGTLAAAAGALGLAALVTSLTGRGLVSVPPA
ncbi:MAG: CrcB family protein [Halobacteriaceae archaeon]